MLCAVAAMSLKKGIFRAINRPFLRNQTLSLFEGYETVRSMRKEFESLCNRATNDNKSIPDQHLGSTDSVTARDNRDERRGGTWGQKLPL